jgi:hypothetical protein
VTGQPGCWTIAEACREFAAQGMPVDPARFTAVVRAVQLPRAGELRRPPGGRGGRGHALYPIGELQRLHAALSPWLVNQPA